MISNRNSAFWRGLAAAALLPAVPLASQAQGVVFSDDFDTDSAARWNVFDAAAGDVSGVSDFEATFNYDYSTVGIPAAPNSTGGTTRGVRLSVNNVEPAERAAVSLFPKDVSVSGTFALRFDMWINYNGGPYGGSGSTEFALAGLNHAGDKVIWPLSPDSDGVFFAVTGEGGAARDYRTYVGQFGNSPVEQTFFDGGFLDRDGSGTAENEGFAQNPAEYPLNFIFPSPPFETLAMPGKQWVQGEVRQENGRIVWSLNGFVIADYENFSGFESGTPMLGYMDIFNSIANPAEDNFVIYDNVRVVDLSVVPPLPQVGVEATDATGAEPGTDTLTFTIDRTGDTSAPLTVKFRFAGQAVPGADFDTAALTAAGEGMFSTTIPAGASSVDVVITPLNDTLGESDETLNLVLLGTPGVYEVGARMFGFGTLLDDGDTAAVNIELVDGEMYERDFEDRAVIRVTREGTTESNLAVNLQFGGTAGASDYTGGVTSVLIPAGASSFDIELFPTDDALVEGAETIEVAVVAGAGYGPGPNATASVRLRDDEREDLPVLFAEGFDTDVSGAWNLVFSSGNGFDDFRAQFGYDYSFDGVAAAPNSPGGSTTGLKVTVNKDEPSASGAAALNLYLKDRVFSGNYAVRFNMYLTFDSFAAGTTEHSIFGVNHGGSAVNRHGTPGGDGLWFAVESDGSGSGGRSYVLYESADPAVAPTFVARPASELAGIFRTPPYAANGAAAGAWVDVEIRQQNRMLTLLINGATILTKENVGSVSSGTLMLGHMDTFASIGAEANFTIFDNLQVVDLGGTVAEGGPVGVTLTDGKVILTWTDAGTLEVSDSFDGPFTPVAGATSPFEVTPDGAQKFYRLR